MERLVKRVIACAAGLAMLTGAPGMACACPFPFVEISASDQTYVRHVPAFQGDRTIFAWCEGTNYVARIEFGLTGTLEILEVRPSAGFVNAGTTQSPVLVAVAPDCVHPDLGMVIAEIDVRDDSGLGGNICLEPSAANGRICLQPCDDDRWFQLEHWYGFSSGAAGGCDGIVDVPNCAPSPVDGSTWGGTKALYR